MPPFMFVNRQHTINSRFITYIWCDIAESTTITMKKLQWTDLHSQMTPHTSPSWASYGMSFMSYMNENNQDIPRVHCINLRALLLRVQGPPLFEFPRAPSNIWRVPPLKYTTNSPILRGPLGPQAKFHKGPIGFSGAQGPYLQAPRALNLLG